MVFRHFPTFLVIVIIFEFSSTVTSSDPIGVVVSNAPECADIGKAALDQGGSAVDAVVSTLFCEGLTMPHSMGIGGGFLATIYLKKEKRMIALTARETAPASSTVNMYGGAQNLTIKGGASVAIPGELMGYWEAHQRYGRLPWASLVEPTIDLCFRGHLVTPLLARVFRNQEAQIRSDPGLSETFINPNTNGTYQEGDYLRRPVLGRTLQIIARDGAGAFYDGALTRSVVDELRNLNGSITLDDMKGYRVLWNDPLQAEFPDGRVVYAPEPPSLGSMLIFILNVLNGFLDTSDIDTVTNWQRIVESFKYAYAYRTRLGDQDFVPGMEETVQRLISKSYATEVRGNISDTRTYQDPEHYGAEFYYGDGRGTSNIVVVAPDGDAVAATSTLNQNFGSGILLPTTDIVLNDQMYDFASPGLINFFGMPPSIPNFIQPGKRPLSSSCPSIVLDENGDVVLVIGAAGASKLTSIALVTMRYLWFNEPLLTALEGKRLHHQLLPMRIDAEYGFDQDVLDGLAEIGHVINVITNIDGLSPVTAIEVQNGTVNGVYDARFGGSISYIYPN